MPETAIGHRKAASVGQDPVLFTGQYQPALGRNPEPVHIFKCVKKPLFLLHERFGTGHHGCGSLADANFIIVQDLVASHIAVAASGATELSVAVKAKAEVRAIYSPLVVNAAYSPLFVRDREWGFRIHGAACQHSGQKKRIQKLAHGLTLASRYSGGIKDDSANRKPLLQRSGFR